MNKRLIGALKSDLLFQFRSGFHVIYLVLSVFYIVVINLLPENWAGIVAPFMIFSDPSVLGFFFIGGLIMLEKGQGILALLSVTPLTIEEYIMAKVLSLTMISILSGVTIALLTHQSFNWLLLLLTLVMTASVFTLIGCLLAIKCHTVNQYFGRVIPWMMVIILPCFSLVGFPMSWLFYCMPSVAAAKLFMITFAGGRILDLILCCGSMMVWGFVLFRRTLLAFEAYSLKVGV